MRLIPGSLSYRRAFSFDRNRCSRSPESVFVMPESAFMMTGIDVQHRSESVFTFDRNRRSGWAGLRRNPATVKSTSALRSARVKKVRCRKAASAAIRERVDAINDRPMKVVGVSRRTLFDNSIDPR